MNLYVGTSGYSYKEWKGSFYPKDLPASRMLRFYAERFRAVEINSTFYRLPEPSVLEAWAAEVPADFRFAIKAPQRITHIQRLKDAAEAVSRLREVCGVLRERLGPLLFQLPPNMKKDAARLREFLALLPGCRAVFEFRHSSWFDQEVFDSLRAHQAALCIAQGEGTDAPLVATAEWGYLRLRRPDYADAELKDWVDRALGQGWREAFVFFKHEDEGTGPRFAQRFMDLAVAAR